MNNSLVNEVFEKIDKFLDVRKEELTSQQVQSLKEIKHRLIGLHHQYNSLMLLNSQLEHKLGIQVIFDQDTDTLTYRFGDMEQKIVLNREDPNVPITQVGITSGGAYHAASSGVKDAEEADIKLNMEVQLESFYQSSHKVLKLFGKVTGLKIIKHLPTTHVRNLLIEHPEDFTVYSFGFGSTGPRVKPIHNGKYDYNDEGLTPNSIGFLQAIKEGLENNLKKR